MVSLLLAVIYLAFISLGLPDSLLGAGWPVMHGFFGVPLAYGGVVSMVISLGTVTSSLLSERLTKRFGAKYVTVVSVGLTALALLGFSVASRFWMLCLWAVPYGLGAGSIDAALNNYVALHYTSRHMSWLHCFWGVAPERAAAFASLFFIGITAGRFLAGFVSNRLGDRRMIRLGTGILFLGVALLLIPGLPEAVVLTGCVVIGLGCAPIYPSIIHATPDNFGPENSQAIIGVQMASAYVGSTFAPPLFGFLSGRLGLALFPFFVACFGLLMIAMVERAFKMANGKE